MAKLITNAIINGVKGDQVSVSIFRASDENGKAKGFVSGLLNLKKENRDSLKETLTALDGKVASIEVYNPDFVVGDKYKTKDGEEKQSVNCYGLLSRCELNIS